MIRCHVRYLERRCEERGYSWDFIQPCIVEIAGDYVVVDETHQAYPRRRPKKPGLGDMVKAGLSAIGITPERVSAVTGKPCGCKKRQAKLNSLGRRLGIG